MKLTQFRIDGLFGDRRVTLQVDKKALILVGPNGLGKSSVANMFYFTISRQWTRLLDYNFKSITLIIDDEEITFKRDEVSGLLKLSQVLGSSGSRANNMIQKLISSNLFNTFIEASLSSTNDRTRYADILGIPRAEVRMFQRYLHRKINSEDDLFAAPRVRLEEQLAKAIPFRVLYLPTYRRIERDMRDVFPNLEERYRQLGGTVGPIEAGRSGNFYVELVNFGMEDVKRNIQKVTQDLRGYSLSQYNNLSASYLRDVIRGKADQYDSRDLASLNDNDINAILNRVNESALSKDDKILLQKRIKEIQAQTKAKTRSEDRYLAHYFSRLVSTTNDIVRNERNVAAFVNVCNAYLRPSKYFDYDEVSSTINIYDDRDQILDLSVLSSGEKQIISLFSHLYLEDALSKIIIIDEPELSLSVPWQRRFLLDIIESGRCDFLLAVTHSPFVYDNGLKPNAMDLRKLTERA